MLRINKLTSIFILSQILFSVSSNAVIFEFSPDPKTPHKKLKVDLTYEYKDLDPSEVSHLEQSQMLKVSSNDPIRYVVTTPLRPCTFISVWNPNKMEGILFHKYGKNKFDKNDEGLTTTILDAIGEAKNSKVDIYSCRLPEDYFFHNFQQNVYSGKSQIEDTLDTVKYFLNLGVPKENIIQKLYSLHKDLQQEFMGIYQDVHLSIGFDKESGTLFHTSFLANNLFNVTDILLKCEGKITSRPFKTLPATMRVAIHSHVVPMKSTLYNHKVYSDLDTDQVKTYSFSDKVISFSPISFSSDCKVVINNIKYHDVLRF